MIRKKDKFNELRLCSYLLSQVSTPGASITQDMTAVNRSTKAYMNLASAAFPQELGHTAQVVLTHVPVIQQARLLKLSIPPISLRNVFFGKYFLGYFYNN